MIKTNQFSTWAMPTDIQSKDFKNVAGDDVEDKEERYRSIRDKRAFAKYFFLVFMFLFKILLTNF